ncbi:MAG: M13 family metallopeptidase [Sphingomonas sp.]|uniref:M13 family metallopeptidase n=1 Tax=Sphingomonas sp. TaxID=28214 RepID=UPI0017D0A151|nr:M13 family metallopeptidase [Sphingomonas sp.]MBA3667419.1 M13 family metallopeptidase [Sphingomonas sp.]
MIRRISCLASLGALALALATAAPGQSAEPAYGSWGIDPAAMDGAVNPGDDFFAYVNGAWSKRTEIAADRTFVGIDSVLNDQIEKDVRSIIEDQAHNPAANGLSGQQVGDFYASFMDEAGIEALGAAPLRPYLARIDAVKNRAELATLFGSTGYTSPIGLFFSPNPDVPTRYSVFATQSGLGMPGRDYYLLPGPKYVAFRKAYRDYVIKIQTLAGIPGAAAKTDRIIALETAIARVHWTPERSRDTKATTNPMTLAELKAFAPDFDWDRFLAAQGITNPGTIIVQEKSAIADEAKLVASQPLDDWKDYLAYRFASSSAPYLPKSFAVANFDFYSKTLRDVPTERPRWKRGVSLVNASLGEAVGHIYVQRHYPAESDRQMGELISDIRAALKDKIDHSGWMDAATKAEAATKLASFDPRTGHPVKYIDYSTLKVTRGDLLGNVMRAHEFEEKRQLALFPKPVDRAQWGMLPQTNNAYYDPSTNQITFPAAILQPPYFDPRADPAANYGSIGATIGHEIGHGFDDQGRLYDGTGRLSDWWTAASAKAYGVQTAALVKQYDGYEPIPGTHIKGELTLGENIGDLGGLEVAYAAYRRYVAKHGEPPVIDALTGDQRFFIAYGYSWQSKFREGVVRNQLLTDPHSPAAYRVNGVVRNVDAWYRAFNVRPGNKMYLPPERRVHIW